ncbi:MAG: hypothetical protein ACLQBQ_12040, partial [Smithella sp.]
MQKNKTLLIFVVILVLINLYGCSHLQKTQVSPVSSENKSTDASYHYSLGVLLRLDGKLEEATEEFKQA